MTPDIPIAPPWACPACDGTGGYRTGPNERQPCWFCNATGDQREMPPEWLACPARNERAYHAG